MQREASALPVDHMPLLTLVHLYLLVSHGGVELCGRERAEELPLFQRLCVMSALSAWRGPTLPHLGGVQYQAAVAAARPTSHQDLPSLGTHMAKHCRLGTRNGVRPQR